MRKLFTTIVFAASLLAGSATSFAAPSAQIKLKKADVNLRDTDSLIRGAKTFMAYCATCHSAEFMRYSRIGKDMGLSEDYLLENLVAGDGRVGDTIPSGMPADYAQRIFGKVPPDLSVVTRAYGADWLYTYLISFYEDDSTALGVNNAVYKDVGMPNVFAHEQGTQRAIFKEVDGGENSETQQRLVGVELVEPGSMSQDAFETMIRDLVNFMVYMGEPAQLKRMALGPWVLGFIAFFTLIMFFLKKEVWRDVKKVGKSN